MATQKRRRGAALQQALLESAWVELQEKGYAAVTMDGVAKRAATTKTVLYRRWPKKVNMVIAAARAHLPSVLPAVHDTGSLAGDLYDLLAQIAALFQAIPNGVLTGIVKDAVAQVDLKRLFALMNQGDGQDGPTPTILVTAVNQILQQATQRGELNGAAISAKQRNLFNLLLVNAVLTEQVQPAELRALADDVLLPLWRQVGQAK